VSLYDLVRRVSNVLFYFFLFFLRVCVCDDGQLFYGVPFSEGELSDQLFR